MKLENVIPILQEPQGGAELMTLSEIKTTTNAAKFTSFQSHDYEGSSTTTSLLPYITTTELPKVGGHILYHN